MKTSLRQAIAAFGLAIFNVSTVMVQAGDYLYETNNGTITITGYTGPGGDVTIPSQTNGLPVVSIGEAAFAGCTNLTSITIPDGVTSIASGAFSGCTSLTSVAIPNSVTEIRKCAFSSCSSLISVAIPNSVTTIGPWAFSGCTSLTSVTIGNSVTNIYNDSFGGCTNLTSITVEALNPAYSSLDGVLFDKLQTRLIECPEGKAGSYTVPNSVTSIGDSAFHDCASLTSVTIPNSVTNIGWYAFSCCSSLTGVYFRGNAPALGEYVFFGTETVYYLPGTTGWGTTFEERPTAPWMLPYPVILTTAPNFGIQTNTFGFRISWATNASVVVEASTTLANSTWSPIRTNTLTDGWSYFSDAVWMNYPNRFYRVRSP